MGRAIEGRGRGGEGDGRVAEVLSTRALNRALLARQGLLEPLRSLTAAERTEVEAEGERLLAWHEPRGDALGVDLRARFA